MQRVSRTIQCHPKSYFLKTFQSDGSQFVLKSTSPNLQLQMTKDTRNSPLWNLFKEEIESTSEEVSKFNQKYGEIDKNLFSLE